MRYSSKNGFTLIEVLFAMAIIAIAAMAIARSSLNNIEAVNKNRLRLNALNIAQSKLIESINDQSYLNGNSGIETVGTIDYKWKTGYSDIAVSDQQQKYNYNMKNISVTTSWNYNEQEYSITTREYLWLNSENKAQPSSN